MTNFTPFSRDVLQLQMPDFMTFFTLQTFVPDSSAPQPHRSVDKEGKSAINLSNLGNFCQIWPRVIYLC